jgi:predicted DNA-binding ArsR family transcriptional regulator
MKAGDTVSRLKLSKLFVAKWRTGKRYTDPEKELDHTFYKKRLPLTIQMLQEVGIIYAQNVQKSVKNICAR